LNPDEIRDVFELRVLLETDIAKRSIARRTEADIARVYELADRMRQLADASPDTNAIATWYDLNADFHDALLVPAGWPHHMRALDTARGLIEAYIRAEVRFTGHLQQAQEEHTQLAQAFVKGDAAEFVAQIREHSYHTRDRLLAGLGAKGGGASAAAPAH
jgi:DNA-binding GntR family transcriptional regulator